MCVSLCVVYLCAFAYVICMSLLVSAVYLCTFVHRDTCVSCVCLHACPCICVMCVSVGLLCCPFVRGLSVFVTLCLGVSPWCLHGSLWCACLWSWGFTSSVACVGLCNALTLLRGRVHLCRGPACLCVLNAAHHPCVFVCDVYVSPSAERCPPLYVLCLSVRVSATWVSHVWAACACRTSASWRGAHVSVPVACHSSVRARHGGPWVPPHEGLVVPVCPSPSPPSWQPMLLGSQLL